MVVEIRLESWASLLRVIGRKPPGLCPQSNRLASRKRRHIRHRGERRTALSRPRDLRLDLTVYNKIAGEIAKYLASRLRKPEAEWQRQSLAR